MVRPLLGSALCMSDFDESWVGTNMCSISCARTSCIDLKANRIHLNAPSVSAAGVRNVIQLFAVALGAASLAACAQSSVVTQKSELSVASRQASLEHNRTASFVTNRRVAITKKHTPYKNAAETQVASHGLASFYTEGTQTASGERFDTRELTGGLAWLRADALRLCGEAVRQNVDRDAGDHLAERRRAGRVLPPGAIRAERGGHRGCSGACRDARPRGHGGCQDGRRGEESRRDSGARDSIAHGVAAQAGMAQEERRRRACVRRQGARRRKDGPGQGAGRGPEAKDIRQRHRP